MVFRKLTNTDWKNINRPDPLETGGGQGYIDFSTSRIAVNNWRSFFPGIPEESVTNGSKWTFTIKSLGVFQGIQKEITVDQRRPTTFSIKEQNIHRTNSKRVFAWMPDLTGFPEPDDPANITSTPDSLYVYIVRLQNGEHWAGWFQSTQPKSEWYVNDKLTSIFSNDDGYLDFDNEIVFDTSSIIWPFKKA